MAIELVKNKKHLIVKRDGRIEPYQEEKMRKVLRWAIEKAVNEGHYKWDKQFINGKIIDQMIDEVLENVSVKIYDKISISKLFDAVIETCESFISRLQPVWDDVTKNLLVQKYYKETWGIKRDEYPDYLEVVKKGASAGIDIYKKIKDEFTEEEIKQLGSFIKPEKDFYFTSLGIKSFMTRYALKYSKTKQLELPQHTFLRLAIKSFMYDDKEKRFEFIKQRYEDLSDSIYTEATPRYNDNDMEASCVLMKMGDDSWSITRTLQAVGLYSKHGGGTAVDVCDIRCRGSLVGVSGESDGVIPFIRDIETVIQSFKQGGVRRGACAVYFNWWHYEVEDLIMLKDEGGNEWKRARSLQYGIKLNRLFLDRIINNEEITLFDPKETPELLGTFGNEFEKWYIHYEQKGGIRKKKIKARDLAYLLAKVRLETGNLYIFFDDNVNENKPFEDYISQSNLCSEIVLPTKPSYLKNANVKQDLSSGELTLVEKVEPGRIALCNLSSINVVEWSNLSNERKRKIAYTLLRSHDNLIDLGFYPVKEGEISNKLTRPIGIGITNLAYYFAKNKIKFTDDKVLKLQFDIIEDVAYYFIEASIELAKERGAFPEFRNSKWSNGWLPIDYNKELFDKYADVWQHHRWADLRNAIMSYGIRFSTHFAIAPTATSALSIKGGSTESINPPKNLFQQKTGTINGVQLAPQFNKYGKWYQTAYEVPNERLIELAAIRQLFLDQAQSVDTFYANPDSAFDVIKDIIFAEKQGLKTLYYANSLKAVEKEVCESCSS